MENINDNRHYNIENNVEQEAEAEGQEEAAQGEEKKSNVDLSKKPSASLLEALNDLRLRNQLTDAIVKVVDGSFPVHRAMMSASSFYFRAQFTGVNARNAPQTSETHQVFIPGMSAKILKELIDYAYLKKCNINKENVYEMLVSADYVGMTCLVIECTRFLEKMLTPENCLSMIKFAKFRFLDPLHFIARHYLLGNFTQIFSRNNDILDLCVDEFFDIVDDDHLNTKDEDSVWNLILKWIERDPANRRHHIGKLLNAVRTGLMTPRCFLEELKIHPYVRSCPGTRQLIVETFRFMYDLDIMNPNNGQLLTPHLAMPRLPHEVIFAIGGWSGGVAKAVIETYDTRADRWVSLDAEDPAGPRAYHGTTVIGCKIYVIGGYDGVEYFNTCRVFDAQKRVWNEIAPMHSRRCYVSCANLNGLIYAIGGYDGHNRLNTVERYNPQTNQWSMIAPMLMQRSDASACTLNGRIYATGGFNGQECLDTAEYFNPDTNQWTRIGNMSNRRSGVSCVAFRGGLYVIGGFNGTARLATGERFDLDTQRWYPIHEMNHCRSNFGLEVIDDMIFAIGGFNGVSTISHTECYVPETNEWMEASDMNVVRSAVTANTLSNLPNINDYIHKDRERLMEERRLRLFSNTGIINPNQPGAAQENVGGEEDEALDGYNSPNEDEDLDMEMELEDEL